MIDPNILKIINERIKLEIEQQSKYLLEETDRLKAEMAAKGLSQSGAMIKRIAKLCEQSIENRAQRIWETISIFITISKVEYSESLAADLKKIVSDYMPDSLPDYKHHIERNISRFSIKSIPIVMEDLEVARAISLKSVGTEIDLLVHSLKNKIESAKIENNKAEKLPVFPDILPSSIKEGKFRNLEFGDIEAMEDLKDLLVLLFREKECDFYYFIEKDNGSIDEPLQMAKNNGDILMQDVEFFYFKHPEHDRDYIKIEVRDGKYESDWQKNVVEKGPMYARYKLQLSDRKRTELETLQKIELEEQIRKARKDEKFNYDVFLSYASKDNQEALKIYEAIEKTGRKAFLSEKQIKPGDDFAEEIRQALQGSKELWLLVSPESVKSEWVISEWGAAWVLDKKIIPILHRCDVDSLPDRLRKLHCIDYYKFDELIKNTFGES